jgi:proline dehydrogenase
MSFARNLLIQASQSQWLRERAARWRFVRRASSRFLPGEQIEDALAAAEELRKLGIRAMPSRLGENVNEPAEARSVAEHYVAVLALMREQGLPGSLSVKLTQLGLDLDRELCYRNLTRILDAADRGAGVIWIDMESSAYVDRTLELYRRARSTYPNVGVCLQAYLRRTPTDLASLLPLGPSIRLVKGAYHEPAEVAFPAKRDVDHAYISLMETLFGQGALASGTFAGIATHDPAMIVHALELVKASGVPKDRLEFQMLYGIQRKEQERLAAAGWGVNVLISYGTYWFPWYMRRLAERPANVWFVVKNLFS